MTTASSEEGSMNRTYTCDVVAYPCMTLPDGSTGYCHELSCTVAPDPPAANAPSDEVADDEHQPSFGVRSEDGALRIPLSSLIDILEQMGATVRFDEPTFRESAERVLVRVQSL
jgi:hypothetical protein